MNIILIISIILTIVAAGLYFMAKREVEKQKESVKYWMDRYDMEEKSNLEYSNTIEAYEKTLNQVQKELDQTYESLERAKSELSKCDVVINCQKEELANFQQVILEHENSRSVSDTRLFEPVFRNQVNIEFKGEIHTAYLVINSSLLIGDNRLFDVFKRLINSKLLPESIINSLDFEPKDLSVRIWTQKFDENHQLERCYTWKEIIDQIQGKKSLIIEYLNTVIQDSSRALVVADALNNAAGKEVAA